MKKMILVLANNSDGLYGFRKELLQKLTCYGEVYASVPDNGYFDDLVSIGCNMIDTAIDRRGINPVTDLRLFTRYLRMIRDQKPDLTITYTIKPNIYGGLVCRLLKKPYVVNITGLGTAFQKQGLLRKLVVFLYRTALKKAKTVFFENASNLELFVEERIVNRDQCVLLNGAGVNLERFVYAPYPKEKKIHFLFIGRVMKEKGIEELFAAMDRLHSAGYDCCLDVLGGYEENYKELIHRYEETGWLHYHGYQKDVRPFIEKAHCFVLPSYHEGMANTNLECAAMGRPVITSDIPGCREAVIAGESGLLCKPQDVESLCEAMMKFMSMSDENREQMGLVGRRHMEEMFDKRKVVAETIRALKIK